MKDLMGEGMVWAEDWRFPLEGYSQLVRANVDLDDDMLQVAVEVRRTGLISGRQSPWLCVAFGRVPNVRINCDMWENERWSSEGLIKSLHSAVAEDKI